MAFETILYRDRIIISPTNERPAALRANIAGFLVRVWRLTVCSNCQTPYSDKKPGDICAKCGGTLIRRRDDEPIAVQNRLEGHSQATAPVFNWYKKSGAKVVTVDAVGPVEDVTKRALKALGR